MLQNTTKARLKAGETVLGCFVRYVDPNFTEFAALQGWDFLVFDAEHGTLQPGEVENLCRAVELRGVTPMARATTNQPPVLLRLLDAGVHGVIVPWVNTAAEADRAVRSVKYGPRGQRGLAGSRASDWGTSEGVAEYTQRANRETLVVIQIETAEAAAAIDDYVAIDDIDVLFIGPTDLSHSLGHPGDPSHADVVAVMDRVVDAVVGSDKALGINVGGAEAARSWQDRGARFITTTTEGLVSNGMQAYLSQVREPRS